MERGIYVGAGLTAALGVAAYSLLPITEMINRPTYLVSPLWLILTAGVAIAFLLRKTLEMALEGQQHPIRTLQERFDWKAAAAVSLGSIVLALNLSFFGMIKPQLAHVVDFSADPLLADLDSLILGTDAWRLLLWFEHPGMAALYHKGWFIWLAFVMFFLLKQPPSAEKDRLFISYVLLWTIFGPLVHLALPAAGPVFYDELGLGDRFVELRQSAESELVAAYLWNGYTGKTFNPAGGISAMPSLHLATMFWSIIAVRHTRWLALAIAFTGYIFLGSIAIGWHYAVDGIAGGIGAVLCYALAGLKFAGSVRLAPRLSPSLSVAAEGGAKAT